MNSTYTCQYRGHEEEPIIGLCLFRECQNKPQYCGECLMSHHSTHMKNCKSMIKLKQMVKGFQTEIIDWLYNIEGQYKKISTIYQQTVKLLTNEKNRMIEFEKYLQNEEYKQITERIIVIKQINAIQETKQDIKQMNILGIINLFNRNVIINIIYLSLKYINDQLESLKFDQRDFDDLQIVKISQTSFISEDSKILQNQIDQETEKLIQNSVIKTQEGKIHIDNGRYNEAISCLDDAIKINDKNNVAYREKGYYSTKNRVGVIDCLKQQGQLNQESIRRLLNTQIKLYFWIIKMLLQCIERHYRSCFNSYCQCQLSIYNLSRDQEVIVCLDLVISLDQKYKDAYIYKGVALIVIVDDKQIIRNLNRYEEAIICYDQAIQLDQKYKLAYYNKGVALIVIVDDKQIIRNLNRYEEAIICYDQAIQLDQKYKDAYCNKGLVLILIFDDKQIIYNLNRYEEAIICYDQAIQLDQKYKDAYCNKGVALIVIVDDKQIIEYLNRYEEAIICYDLAIQLDPQFKLAINNKRNALQQLFHNFLNIRNGKEQRNSLKNISSKVKIKEYKTYTFQRKQYFKLFYKNFFNQRLTMITFNFIKNQRCFSHQLIQQYISK